MDNWYWEPKHQSTYTLWTAAKQLLDHGVESGLVFLFILTMPLLVQLFVFVMTVLEESRWIP